MLNLEERKHYRIALHHLGFRPLFLLAGVFAILVMVVWWWQLQHVSGSIINPKLAAVDWHAHEMVYGYTVAVIGGFLLTAVRNWTNVPTLHGVPLLLLALIWLAARLCPFMFAPNSIYAMVVLDLAFDLLLLIALTQPIVKSRQWNQTGILLILSGITACNSLFYLGLFELISGGIRVGIYSGLYLVIFLIMLMGRRVIPFFIEKGVDGQSTICNRRWLDVASLVLMLIFLLAEAVLQFDKAAAISALVLFGLQIVRLYDWHTPGIWKKPLLWSLYLAYGWITLAFGLKVLGYSQQLFSMSATHAFTVGGIGLMTLSMMCRVSLGHTGRNVFAPPASLSWLFVMLFIAAVVRVLLPLLLPEHYILLVSVSQLLWIIAFAGFVVIYAPMLVKPRIDGRYG